jgi:hypothetical protein
MRNMGEVVVLKEKNMLPIESALYNAEDTSSNEVHAAPSEFSSVCDTTVSLGSNPFVALQMVEARTYGFVSSIDLVRCHLISKVECANNKDFQQLDRDENNCLYMSWPMHQRFDGLYGGVPTIAIRFDKVLGHDHENNRTKVSIIMEFRKGDKKTPDDIKSALGHHSYDPVANEFTCHVSVTDPEIFKMCLSHKHAANVSIWNGGPNFNQQKAKRKKLNIQHEG